jgi:hypothetical protein
MLEILQERVAFQRVGMDFTSIVTMTWWTGLSRLVRTLCVMQTAWGRRHLARDIALSRRRGSTVPSEGVWAERIISFEHLPNTFVQSFSRFAGRSSESSCGGQKLSLGVQIGADLY